MVGDRFALGKAEVLRELGAQVYVGDHPGDVVAAIGRRRRLRSRWRPARPAPPTCPPPGPRWCSTSLEAFPEWLDEHVLLARLDELDAALPRR